MRRETELLDYYLTHCDRHLRLFPKFLHREVVNKVYSMKQWIFDTQREVTHLVHRNSLSHTSSEFCETVAIEE